jgi:hypothetical protein
MFINGGWIILDPNPTRENSYPGSGLVIEIRVACCFGDDETHDATCDR